MCFPCWKYEDVYFEERPKPHKVNKHPHAGTIYTGYYVPSSMLPAPLPGVAISSPIVPITRPIVPALLPVGPATGLATTPVSSRAISLHSDSFPTSQLLSATSRASPRAESSLGRWSHRFTHRMPLTQLHKRNFHFFDFFSPQPSPGTNFTHDNTISSSLLRSGSLHTVSLHIRSSPQNRELDT